MKYIKLIAGRILFILGILGSSPLILLAYLELLVLGNKSERVFGECKEILALIPTFIGVYLRLGFYWAVCESIASNVTIGFGSMIAHRNTVIGSGTMIGCYSVVGYAEIGEYVIIGSKCSVISGAYQHGRPDERIADRQPTAEYQTIKIGSYSWIGEGALIIADIGENCVVGTGSVVIKEIPDKTTVMGNPARKINF